ncbi:hypothetical protein BX666DRAFT_1899024 [Dichotomocladium elegans]|nr:hypothetical protein BX666DRAFT_1899024 [Dichotomocladium elegans]
MIYATLCKSKNTIQNPDATPLSHDQPALCSPFCYPVQHLEQCRELSPYVHSVYCECRGSGIGCNCARICHCGEAYVAYCECGKKCHASWDPCMMA